MMDRRVLLRAAAGAATAGLVGCGRSGGALEVAVVHSGSELALFRDVVRAYPGRRVEVISAGDEIDALLRARDRAGARPDVALLPRPGLVAGYAADGWLEPLDPALADRFAPVWNQLVTFDGRLYGAWVKAAHKSLFWYLPSMLPDPPRSWGELLAMVESAARGGGPAPLAVGAADGWVLTDWLENLLAGFENTGPYQRLVAGEPAWDAPEVRVAFGALAQIWGVPGALAGGARRALLTQYEESVIQVTSRRALTVFEGDFVGLTVRRFRPPGDAEEPRTFRFPGFAGPPPLVVGGDAAVVLRGSPDGHDLVRWLTGPDAFLPWITGGGFLSPNIDIPPEYYPAGQQRELAAEIRDPDDGLVFDLSDQLPGNLSGFDGQGIWKILQDFFAAVTAPSPDPERAIDTAIARLNTASKRARA